MPLEGRHTSKWLPYPYFLRKSPQRLSRATHEGFIDNPPPSVTVTDICVSGSTVPSERASNDARAGVNHSHRLLSLFGRVGSRIPFF